MKKASRIKECPTGSAKRENVGLLQVQTFYPSKPYRSSNHNSRLRHYNSFS
ncbi:hypothetical protein CCACVL1_06375 [Corchorus capsularis]|uniref:Uncharacterized protein n=1 Tax=Corchorus capsularis TaxID=210143 RepID=A0A1R3JFW7_COCAP|nr:hypothetical protein CCACVL1_06375 [Corchorus capsularis]